MSSLVHPTGKDDTIVTLVGQWGVNDNSRETKLCLVQRRHKIYPTLASRTYGPPSSPLRSLVAPRRKYRRLAMEAPVPRAPSSLVPHERDLAHAIHPLDHEARHVRRAHATRVLAVNRQDDVVGPQQVLERRILPYLVHHLGIAGRKGR